MFNHNIFGMNFFIIFTVTSYNIFTPIGIITNINQLFSNKIPIINFDENIFLKTYFILNKKFH